MDFSTMRAERIKTVVRYHDDTRLIRATSRRDHIIGIKESGIALHDFGYKHIKLEPDCIYFFNQKDDYTAAIEEPGLCHSIHFTTTEPIETESFCKKINNPKQIKQLILRVERAFLRDRDNDLETLSHFYRLCSSLYEIYRAPYAQKDDRIRAAKLYIDLHFKEADCLEVAAKTCGVSRRRFNDIFKAHFQITPNRYTIQAKVSFAKELLEIGYRPMTAVAELCGFSDIYYFSKVFKAETGMTPGQYKTDTRKEN